MTTQRIARLGLLTALVVVGRTMFQFLPNVQPMTVILLLVVLTFGVSDGLIVATLSILISNIQMGMGVWTIAQIGTYIALMILTGALRPVYDKLPNWLLACYAGFVGFAYGFLISLIQAVFFSMFSFWPYWIAGLSFDAMHAFGNIAFWLILAPVLIPLFKRKNYIDRSFK